MLRGVNFFEVTHCRWRNRDPSGISLLEVALFDVRNSLLTNGHFEELQSGTYDGGFKLSIPKMNIVAEKKKKTVGITNWK